MSLRRAVEACVGHGQMENHPRDFRLPLVIALDTEEVDVEVQVGLQVALVHSREAPRVALDSGAEVVYERSGLEMGVVSDVRLVGCLCQR